MAGSTNGTSKPRDAHGRFAAANGHAPLKQQLAVLSETFTRLDFARRHGMQYSGERDLYRVGGYPRRLNFQDYYDLYDRDGVAGEVVDMIPETTWRMPPEVSEPEQEDGTEFTRAWEELVNRLGVWQRLERADRLSRIGQYAVLHIGTAGSDDRVLARPLTSIRGPDDVLYLQAYHEAHAKIESWVTNPADARFGMPETYKLNLTSGVDSFRRATTSSDVIVHHSRVLHIAENLLVDEVHGRPALRRVYNDLHDLQKVSTSTGEAFWQRVAGILTASIEGDAGMDESTLNELGEALQELYHDLRRTFLGQNVKLARLAESEPDPSAAANLYMTRIAAGARIPKRMLFGSETGERASTEDQKSFLGSIAARQTKHAEPALLRALIDRLVLIGGLPRPGSAGYDVVWLPLFQESETEIATANRTRAEAAKNLTAIGGAPMDLVEIDEDRNVWLRPTGDRDALTPEELEPPEPEVPTPVPGGEVDPDVPEE